VVVRRALAAPYDGQKGGSMSSISDDSFFEPFGWGEFGHPDPDDAYDGWRDSQAMALDEVASLYPEQTISERFWRQPDGSFHTYHDLSRFNDGSPF